ncbi:MAG: hypothetical protein H6712_27015 [Myxococcales bacterium]|nr:hypothetical protein [Myxococcales bacterium]MCB9717528.1 hypothetical protein [Myxococcales bacterium]
MAREIIVSYQGKPSTFGFARVSRKQLYASRKRIPLDPTGEPCRRAELSDDGSMLIVSGMTAQGYFAEDGRWVGTDELVGLDPAGKPLPEQPSTLGAPQDLQEVEPEALLDLTADSVYALDPGEVDGALTKALQAGKLFRFPFNLRADYNMETAILVGNEQGIFAVIGDTMQVPWCELEKPAMELDDEESDDDELDFEMF